MEPAIQIDGLTKIYHRIGEDTAYSTLRDTLANLLRKKQPRSKPFTALRDVSIRIEPGERVGIIGRNGAGKSTLLKIISRITPPTKGRVVLDGRVASLLEVGTGFHPELTGRENIYLNGSILGLKRSEINERMEAIVEFSGVKDFIHTPLKNYSSGMQLRLAFSVAAHLEPEILLIDEVLAVGDIEFQKRCIGKMEEVSRRDGRTILFVSHNMNYISSFCNKTVLLEKGQVTAEGNTQEVINRYLDSLQLGTERNLASGGTNIGDEVVHLMSLKAINDEGITTERFKTTETIGIEMKYTVLKSGYVLWLGHNLYNDRGNHVFDVHDVNHPLYQQPHEAGDYSAVVWVPPHFLNTGTYLVSSAVFNHLRQVIHFHVRDAFSFSVYDVIDEETAKGQSPGEFGGVVRPLLNWTITKQ